MKVWERAFGALNEQAVRSMSLGDVASMLGGLSPEQLLPSSWGNITNEELTQSWSEAYRSNGPIFALTLARLQVFSQARFQWTRWTGGTPNDLFGSPDLRILEIPWPGGTTADLLAKMEVDASTNGNAFIRRLRRGSRALGTYEDRLVRLRPDWVSIVLGSKEDPETPWESADVELVGYVFRPAGDAKRAIFLDRKEVAHYAPLPDPVASYRGMSWVTPSMPSVLADDASEIHKRKFFQNAATPNLAIKFDASTTRAQVEAFKEMIEVDHTGVVNAYKTLFLGGGADPVVLGKDFKELDFSTTQGKGESRLASNAGVPPSWVGFSEGLQGSALNAGNFAAARRRFGDGTMAHLWGAAARALEVLVEPPVGTAKGAGPPQLWHDTRSVTFLREDAKDHADTQMVEASTMKTLIEAGYDPASVTKAVSESDWSVLKHAGLVSVQLQEPGAEPGTPDPSIPPTGEAE